MPADTITQTELNRALLARQWLLRREPATALAAIEHLAALQAQEAKPPYVGLWTRLESFAREDLNALLRARLAVRATMMRATIHLMSARDFLEWRTAIQPVLTGGMQSVLKDRMADVDMAALLAGAREFFGNAPSTFDDLRNAYAAADPECDTRALAYAVRLHLPLVMAPTDAPWGYPSAAQFTLVETWLGAHPSPAEAQDDLALRYLAAFGPASVADFQTWSGLKGAKAIFERLRHQLQAFRDERKRELFDIPNAPRPEAGDAAPARFLPEFDSALLAHADRSRVIADEYRPLVVTKNLRVLATFLVDGYVAGTWTTERKKRSATLILKPFAPLPQAVKEELSAEGHRLLRFMEEDAETCDVQISSGYERSQEPETPA
ncbi:hypothetical protein CCAX7_20930 [Capsulimonas corticalis]|uniref:Uncharacterized protein n=1 Tax=Capsulimonas corticalis TaxID=2219043 RepID=A0A402D2D6_9BACT|nr:winged helix DNA-binding domain-containing protein [Capsulimonas corticalis]BDI30042.1 hypothetical protein CCAX7_20930 [Capsulimonas corticalis]